MSDLVKLYNPANSDLLTDKDIAAMQKLTTDQIKELATAYPNGVSNRAYLLIVDGAKPAHKQLPSLSTFENLYNLRVKNGLKTFVPFSFKGKYVGKASPLQKYKKSEVLDLSDVELLDLPGFKTGVSKSAEQVEEKPVENLPKATKKEETFKPETVKVTKVKTKKIKTK
jgi:hypothetical protein